MGGAGKGKGKGGGSRARSRSSGGGKGKGKGSSGKGSSTKAKSGKGSASAVEPVSNVKDLPVGLDLTAQYSDGLWYKAKVVQTRKKAPQVKVNFMGYDTSMDLWVGADELRTKLLKKGGQEASTAKAAKAQSPGETEGNLPAEGASCLVDPWGTGEFQAGHVVAVSTNKKRKSAPVKVSIEVWVHPSQLSGVQKAKNTETKKSASAKNSVAASPAATEKVDIPIGTSLQAMAYDGQWYKATVTKLRKSKAPVRVHFDGTDESLDQWCTLDELYGRAVNKAKKAKDQSQDSKAKSKSSARNTSKGSGKGGRNTSKGSGKGSGGRAKSPRAKSAGASSAGGGSTSEKPKRRKGGKGKGKGKRRAAGSGSY